MNVCSLQIRVITDIFRHAEFVRQVMVVVSNIHVVHCVSAIANQIADKRTGLVRDAAVRTARTNGGVQPGTLPSHDHDVSRSRVDSCDQDDRMGLRIG